MLRLSTSWQKGFDCMPSAAHARYQISIVGSKILRNFVGHSSPACAAQGVIDQEVLKAAVANAVGCWEGYFESVLKEFVAKTRVHAHTRAWPLIVQFEVMVDKVTKDLNTPNWDVTRNILI